MERLKEKYRKGSKGRKWKKKTGRRVKAPVQH